MYISEIKLRKLIRQELVKEEKEKESFQKQRTILGDTIELYNQTINLDWDLGRMPWESNRSDIGKSKYGQTLFYGPDEKNVIPVLLIGKRKPLFHLIVMADDNADIPKNKKSFYDSNRRKSSELNYVTTAVKNLNPNITKNALSKIKDQLEKGNIYYAKDTSQLFYPLSKDEEEGIGSYLRDTGIEITANALGMAEVISVAYFPALTPAFSALGKVATLADVANKFDKQMYYDVVFGLISLIPAGGIIKIFN